MVRKPRIDRASEADIAFGILVVAAFQAGRNRQLLSIKDRSPKSRPAVKLRYCGIDHAAERRNVGSADPEPDCSPWHTRKFYPRWLSGSHSSRWISDNAVQSSPTHAGTS